MKRPTSIVKNRQLKEPVVHPTRLTKVIAVIIRQEVVVAKAVEARPRQTQEAASAVAQKDWAHSPPMGRASNEVPAARPTLQLLTTKANRSRQQPWTSNPVMQLHLPRCIKDEVSQLKTKIRMETKRPRPFLTLKTQRWTSSKKLKMALSRIQRLLLLSIKVLAWTTVEETLRISEIGYKISASPQWIKWAVQSTTMSWQGWWLVPIALWWHQ